MEHPIPNEDNKAEAKKTDEKNNQCSVQDPKPDPTGEGGDAEAVKLQSPPDSTGDKSSDYKGIDNGSDTVIKVNLNLDTPRSKKSVTWSQELVMESPSSRMMHSSTNDNNEDFSRGGSNPYVSQQSDPPPASYTTTLKNSMDTVRDVLGRWGKKVGEATKKAEDLAGNTWQHLKTAPSFADAAVGRIAQGTKVLAEGGYENIFRQTFETAQEEQLQNAYACYLSTSAGPVMGILYVSTAKLGFCSDNPLSYKSGEKTEWSYYKVVIPLHQLKAVNPSTSRANPAEKYIQVISVDNHEFWYMGFLNYDGVVQCLQDALEARDSSV